MPEPEQTTEANKAVVRRMIDEVMNQQRLDAVAELFTSELAQAAPAWIRPFQRSFPDMRMRIVDLVAEGDRVVGRFTCSATHTGEWLGHPATGRRFENVAEVYFFRLVKGRIAEVWGLEDIPDRLRQLGLT